MGRPAPEKIIFAWLSMEALTISLKVVKATMILTPKIPVGLSSRALMISFFNARTLASTGFLTISGSRIPIIAPAITPMPP